jgi:hypothetical protein
MYFFAILFFYINFQIFNYTKGRELLIGIVSMLIKMAQKQR